MKLASQLEAKNFWSSFYNIPVNNFHLSRANSRADDSRTWNRYERTTFRRQEIFYVFIVQYFNDRNACFLFFYSYKLIWINFLGTVECINFFIVSYCETGQLQHAARCSCSQFSFSSPLHLIFRTDTCYFLCAWTHTYILGCTTNSLFSLRL